MAKCGHDVCPDDNCGWKHVFNKDRRYDCIRIQRCFEDRCSSLKALGPSAFTLYDACLGHCHRDEYDPKYPVKYKTVDDYLCSNFDPVALVDYFGINVCGVAADQTKVGQAQQAAEVAAAQRRKVLIYIAVMIMILSLILLWKKKRK